MPIKHYIAELIGTFSLTFAVLMSLKFGGPVATPVVAGLTLGLFVYTLGPISGAHLNPAVTVMLLGLKKIEMKDAAMYIISQVAGALLAMGLGFLLGGNDLNLIVGNSITTFVVEALGAFMLGFGVSSVVYGKTPAQASGITIGGSLLFGILLTSGFSFGVLNPAVALGIGSVSLAYILGPIVGAFIAGWVYRFVESR